MGVFALRGKSSFSLKKDLDFLLDAYTLNEAAFSLDLWFPSWLVKGGLLNSCSVYFSINDTFNCLIAYFFAVPYRTLLPYPRTLPCTLPSYPTLVPYLVRSYRTLVPHLLPYPRRCLFSLCIESKRHTLTDVPFFPHRFDAFLFTVSRYTKLTSRMNLLFLHWKEN